MFLLLPLLPHFGLGPRVPALVHPIEPSLVLMRGAYGPMTRGDLTFGVANPAFRHGDVFHNLVASLGRGAAGIFYVLAVAGLGVHLWHGLWSMFQSLGVSNRAYTPGIKTFAVAFAVILGIGFAAIPLAVLFGVIGG